MNRRRISAIVGFLLTLLFSGLALYRVDLREMGRALVRADYRYVVPASIFTLSGYLLRTARWKVILTPAKEVGGRRLFPPLIIGFAVNNLLPARIGEFARAYLLGEREKVSKSLAFATVVVERVLDGLTLILFLLLVSTSFPLPRWGREMEILALLFFLGMLVFLFLLLYRKPHLLRITRLLTGPLSSSLSERVAQVASSFVSGAEALRHRRSIPSLAFLSLLVWSCEAASYLFLTWAFPIYFFPSTRVVVALFIMAVVNLGVLIPSSPGYVGTFHFFAMMALGVFGVEREVALSYALLSHAMQYLLVTGLGLLFLWRENLSLARVGVAPEEELEVV